MQHALYASRRGELRVHPTRQAVARSGWEVAAPDRLIPMPQGTTLVHLPGRVPLGRSAGGEIAPIDEAGAVAVAAVLPPGYLRTWLPAYVDGEEAPVLPLYGYAAVADVDGEPHVAGLRTLRTVDNLELHCLAFLERTEPIALNGRVVHEDITASVALDESVALGVVEPLDLACDTHRSISCLLGREVASLNKKKGRVVRPFPYGARPARRRQ